MKEWRVYAKDRPGHSRGVIIWWPEWDEREARAWFKEHSTEEAGHFYEGMTLELVEFETKEERIHKAAREVIEAHAENVAAGLAQLFGKPGPDPLETSDRLGKAVDALDALTK